MKNEFSETEHNLSGFSVFILESEPSSLQLFMQDLQGMGAFVSIADNVKQSVTVLTDAAVDVIIAGIDLVDEQFIELAGEYKKSNPHCLFYVLVEEGYDSVEAAQESVQRIVDDYLKKPLDADRFAAMIETSTGRSNESSKSLTVIDPLIAQVKPYFLFRSPAMRKTLAHLPQIAASNETVLITGETGAGKEIVARSIHVLSQWAAGPFVPVNCGAIPESLIEGELFGHEKGAFTGAVRTRKGKFEFAHNGTLFLDEIGDMPLHLQVRLLRVLEEGKISRLGSEGSIPVNVRVIAASNTDLRKAVNDNLFREDLYYRLNVLRLHLPPLRERVEDIPLLAVHFLERAFAELGRAEPSPSLSTETIYLLEHYPWKGNVRELRNIMTRVATLLPEDTMKIFPFHVLPYLDDGPQKSTVSSVNTGSRDGVFIPVGTKMSTAEDLLIRETLKHTGGNRTKAAELLGVSLRNLRRKLNKNSSS